MKHFLMIVMLALVVQSAISETPKRIEAFTLPDYNGKKIALDEYNNAKAIVIMFIATECPVSNAYNARYNELWKDYSSQGVVFLGINSNKAESSEDIREHAKENSFEFPILKDHQNIIADKFDAQRTPEIFVLTPQSYTIVYHGRIDDSQRSDKIEKQDLRIALDQILSGTEVTVKETRAFGCTIKRITQ